MFLAILLLDVITFQTPVPFQLEADKILPVPGVIQWQASVVAGFCPPIISNYPTDLGFTVPTGWTVVKTNPDKTLALCIESNKPYSDVFESGCVKSTAQLRVYAIGSNITLALNQDRPNVSVLDASSGFIDDSITLPRGCLTINKEQIIPQLPYYLDGDENLSIYGFGSSNQYVAIKVDQTILTLPITTTRGGRSYFEDSLPQFNFLCKAHVLDVPESWMYWSCNKKFGIVEIQMKVVANKTITRTITVPIISPTLTSAWRNCEGGFHINRMTYYNGTSSFYYSNLPDMSGSLQSGTDGYYHLPLIYGWKGNVWSAGIPCPPPSQP